MPNWTMNTAEFTFLSFHCKNVSNVTLVVLDPKAARWKEKENAYLITPALK